jgi:nitrate reductase gamma subunit
VGIGYAVLGIFLLILVVSIGIEGLGLHPLFSLFIPYFCLGLFIAGFITRVLRWASSPVPFHIPTVSGQQSSLPWIKASRLDSPSTRRGVMARLALEVLVFRSLLKNEKAEVAGSPTLVFKPSIYLWLGAIAFHWSLLVILLRHLRFFLEPIPSLILIVQGIDSLLQGLFPAVYISDMVIVIALVYLFLRRVVYPHIRYISLSSDYFAVFLLLSIILSGLATRLFYKVDLERVKEWVMGMVRLQPALPRGVGLLFYIHLFLISFLVAYFPFSKLMHVPGIFLSPTRNLRNVSRKERHINPWNAPLKARTYEEWEDEFRESMKEAGLPTQKTQA